MKGKQLSLIDLLVVVAIVAILGAILFPVFSQAARADKFKSNDWNLRKLARAAHQYGLDWDDHIPIISNGRWRDIKNIADGQLTVYGEQRTDLWPLLVQPYLGDRRLFIDPQRGDTFGIWSSAPHATTDPGYDPLGATFRNQSRFPMYAVNYLFLSPLMIPASKMSDAAPTDFMVGVPHTYSEADDLSGTVFYAPSTRGYLPTFSSDNVGTLDWQRGFFAMNAPGLWEVLAADTNPGPIPLWTGANCSGDWCGTDLDPSTSGKQTNEGFLYKYPTTQGNNTAFLDLHVKFMTAAQLASGTDYLTATPQDGGTGAFGGGATITDKSQYLWNLNGNYYGA